MISRRVPWNLQPLNGGTVDWIGNPLAKGLRGLLVSHSGIRMQTPIPGTTNSNPFGFSGLSKVTTPGGVFEKHGGAGYASQVSFPKNTNRRHTVVLLLCVTGTVAAMTQFSQTSGAGNGYCARFDINANKTVTAICNGDVSLTSGLQLREGLNVIALTNNRAPGEGEQRFYINGELQGSAASTGWSDFEIGWMMVGQATSGNTSVGAAAYWDRILSAGEVLKLADNLAPLLLP